MPCLPGPYLGTVFGRFFDRKYKFYFATIYVFSMSTCSSVFLVASNSVAAVPVARWIRQTRCNHRPPKSITLFELMANVSSNVAPFVFAHGLRHRFTMAVSAPVEDKQSLCRIKSGWREGVWVRRAALIERK